MALLAMQSDNLPCLIVLDGFGLSLELNNPVIVLDIDFVAK